MDHAVHHDEEFYYDWPVAIFLVENVLFKLPMLNIAKESEVFNSMFTLPQGSDGTVEGRTDDKPIRLEGVKQDDFRPLLKILYPPAIGKVHKLTDTEWLSVLTLATKWDMENIRSLAIRAMGPTLSDNPDPVNLFILGQKFSVDSWTFSAVEDLVLRAQPVDVALVEAIGLSDALKIAAMREGLAKDRGRVNPHPRIDERIRAGYNLECIPEDRVIRRPGW